MRSKILLIAATVMVVLPLLMSSAIAGYKNQNTIHTNGKSVERGTAKINGLDGCRPSAQSGKYMVYVPANLPDGWSKEWEGGPCCPSKTFLPASEYPIPNECCNPPDFAPSPAPPETPTGEHQPGNHCLCFAIRGWPHPPT